MLQFCRGRLAEWQEGNRLLYIFRKYIYLYICRSRKVLLCRSVRKQWRWPGNLFIKWTASSEFGTYSLCEQRRFRRACASAQARQNLRCSLIQAVSQEEPSDGKPDPWPLWMAGHAQLKFVMTECSKTQIRLTRPKWTSSSSIKS